MDDGRLAIWQGEWAGPDPQTAPLVKQAYAAVLAGSSLKDIARLFNDAGAYGLNGEPWTQSTVSLFLRSRATPVCAPTTARSSAKAAGRRWWTNPLGAQRNPCSTLPAAHRAVRVCVGIC